MSKPTNSGRLLTRAVFASSLFVNSLAFADTQVVGVNTCVGSVAGACPPPLTTAAPDFAGNIEITPTGQLNSAVAGIEGITVNDANRIITIDANNTTAGNNAILMTGALSDAIHVTAAGNNANITIQANSNVQAIGGNGNGIDINAIGVTINNAGKLFGDQNAIEVLGGTNTTVTNQSSGSIIADNVAIFDAFGGAQGLSVFNSGKIVGLNDGIVADGFNTIINSTSGTIVSDGHGLDLAGPFSPTNVIENDGLIQGTFNSAIRLDPNYTGILNNNSHGIIVTLDTDAGIEFLGSFSILNNDGQILAPNLLGRGIRVSAASITGTINNNASGEIFGGHAAIGLFGSITQINNAGTLTSSAANGTILAELAGITINGGINNSGNITNETAGGNAINLALAGFSPINQNGGVITGNVLLGTGGNTLTMNGGRIDGNVVGGPGNDNLIVNATAPINGSISAIETITVNNSGTVFERNFPITGMSNQLTLNAGTTMINNAGGDISGGGKIVNFGTILVTDTNTFSVSTITNNSGSSFYLAQNADLLVNGTGFTDNPGSIFDVDILTTAVFGNMVANIPGANTINLMAGSFVRPHVLGFIPDGSFYDIITDIGAGGTILDNSSLIQTSALVFFTKVVIGNTILRLQAERIPFPSFGILACLGDALDVLAEGSGPANPDLFNLLGQFDQLSTLEAVEEAMLSLLPPFNYGLIAASHLSMDSVFDSVQDRIQYVHISRCRASPYHCLINRKNSIYDPNIGIGLGDETLLTEIGDWGTSWIRILAEQLDQGERHHLPGYRAKGLGLAFGLDSNINDCTVLGVAISTNRLVVDDKSNNPKNERVTAWQATLYSGVEFQYGFFLDAMIGLASNHYHLNREMNVNFIHTAAQSEFNGKQYGAQTDLGWTFANAETFYISPFARLEYIHLMLNNYTETGANGLNLSVIQKNPTELLGGLGFKIGTVFERPGVVWVPAEFTAMLANDFKNDGEETFATFTGGGPQFCANGIKPGPTMLDLSVQLTSALPDSGTFSLKYEVQFRDHFISNVAYLQFAKVWI